MKEYYRERRGNREFILTRRFSQPNDRSLTTYIEFGDISIEHGEFYLALMEFIGGKKVIEIGTDKLIIPNSPLDRVSLCSKDMDYTEFVRGALHVVSGNQGRQGEQGEAYGVLDSTAWQALEEKLLRGVPGRDDVLLARVAQLRDLSARKL